MAADGSAVDDSDAPVVPGDEGGAEGVRCVAAKWMACSACSSASCRVLEAWPERSWPPTGSGELVLVIPLRQKFDQGHEEDVRIV